jgi:hypothetical protein
MRKWNADVQGTIEARLTAVARTSLYWLHINNQLQQYGVTASGRRTGWSQDFQSAIEKFGQLTTRKPVLQILMWNTAEISIYHIFSPGLIFTSDTKRRTVECYINK